MGARIVPLLTSGLPRISRLQGIPGRHRGAFLLGRQLLERHPEERLLDRRIRGAAAGHEGVRQDVVVHGDGAVHVRQGLELQAVGLPEEAVAQQDVLTAVGLLAHPFGGIDPSVGILACPGGHDHEGFIGGQTAGRYLRLHALQAVGGQLVLLPGDVLQPLAQVCPEDQPVIDQTVGLPAQTVVVAARGNGVEHVFQGVDLPGEQGHGGDVPLLHGHGLGHFVRAVHQRALVHGLRIGMQRHEASRGRGRAVGPHAGR